MDNRIHIGLDVHKESTAVAILRPGEREPDHRVIATTPEAYRNLVRSLGDADAVYCYEAGPCGFDPYRRLTALGVDCDVIAPTKIPRRSGDRVKTDRLDARNLARLHRAGELDAIRVPSPEREAVRDLIRVREEMKADRRRALQRLKALLLRHGLRYPGNTTGFSLGYERWVCGLRLEQACGQEALDHLLAAVQTRSAQLAEMDRRIEALADHPVLVEAVRVLRAFKGIDTLAAVTIAAEVGDFRAFASAPAFMAFVGLVPSEHSSGQRRRQGSITKAGNAHVRRVLVEAAWAYRFRPAVGDKLRRRQQDLDPQLVAYAWRTQQRLSSRYRKLSITKPATVAATAVARELAGFVWGAMTERYES